jgi:hypothetical protein
MSLRRPADADEAAFRAIIGDAHDKAYFAGEKRGSGLLDRKAHRDPSAVEQLSRMPRDH